MALPWTPQTGDVIFTTQGNPLSALIKIRQGDFDYSHVCMIGEDINGKPTIYTTGGKNFYFYGQVDAENYLKDKTYTIQRIIGGLSDQQKQGLVSRAKKMIGAPYDTAGLLKIFAVGFLPGEIRSLYKPALSYPFAAMKSFFCSPSVAYLYWTGCYKILNKKIGKLDPTAYTLANLFDAPETENVYTNKI